MTGFNDEVRLGQLGEILENDAVVLSVELTDDERPDRPARPEDLLWRGVTLTRYEDGGWIRRARTSSRAPCRP